MSGEEVKPRTQWRMIRQAVSTSHGLAKLSHPARSLFFYLLPNLNAHGKMLGDPDHIRGAVIPLLKKAYEKKKLDNCLKEISEHTNMKWFQHCGIWYIHALNFDFHQAVNPKKRGPDTLPNYSGVFQSSPEPLPECSVSTETVKETVKEKGIYGEFLNVELTNEQLTKLSEKFPDAKDRIEALSGWLAEGNKKKNHYATILNWDRREKKKQKPVKPDFLDRNQGRVIDMEAT